MFSNNSDETAGKPISSKDSKNSDIEKELENAASEDWDDLTKECKSSFTALNTRRDPALSLMGETNIISCDVCKIQVSGSVSFEQHLMSNKHKKMSQKAYMKEKYGKKYLNVKNSLESAVDGKVELPAEPSKDDGDDNVVVLACNVCNKVCTGYICYELHMKGRSHAKKVQQEKLIQKLKEIPNVNLDAEADDSVYEILPQSKPFAHCSICNKKFLGPESYQNHMACGTHKKKLNQLNLIKRMSENGDITHNESGDTDVQPNAEEDMDVDPKPFASCDICSKRFSGPVPFQMHLIGETHKKKMKQAGFVDKFKNLEVKAEDDGSYFCRDCNKVLHDVGIIQQHLKSLSHSKQKARVSMLEMLEKKYPEMVVQSLGANGDEEGLDFESEKGFIIICNLCHKSFSGPESAQDHFISQKHAKARRHHEIATRQRTLRETSKDGSEDPNRIPSVNEAGSTLS